MEPSIAAQDKYDVQQNFRRFVKFDDNYRDHFERLKEAKASRVWIAGVIALLFAFASEFYLGAAAALLVLYFYRVGTAWQASFKADESREEVIRWFHSKGFKLEGQILYRSEDTALENPIDPFNDVNYS
ncbi:hypothetical protein [Aliamphritea spongicola]|uniref:hypothetical protein n=1 Tax=Aliamphritea spongicola TaxID=707589 RepID=UPI00196A687A|nr:hypothetical protein [Aliamphritea spongicola]MBN3561631.1 hypothetical protein [Aliamphritea spongicola]